MNVRTCNWSPYQVWNDCNRATFSRSGRSGGKDLFAGLVNCEDCGATMSVMTGGTVRSLTCAQCGQARRVGMAGRKGGSVSIAGVQEVLCTS